MRVYSATGKPLACLKFWHAAPKGGIVVTGERHGHLAGEAPTITVVDWPRRFLD